MQLLGSQQEFKQIADNTYAGVISKSGLDLFTKALSLTFFFFPFAISYPYRC